MGTAWEGWGREGREARGALTRKDTIKGFGGGFELGFLSPPSLRPCVAFGSLSRAPAAAGPLWQATGSKKGSILEPAIRYCSLGQHLLLRFSSHGYSLTLGLYEIIFQPRDNDRSSGIGTFMPNSINPGCRFHPSAYLIV